MIIIVTTNNDLILRFTLLFQTLFCHKMHLIDEDGTPAFSSN